MVMFGTQQHISGTGVRCQFCRLLIGNGVQEDEQERRTLHESYCHDNPEYDLDGEPAIPPNRGELSTKETTQATLGGEHVVE